MTKFVDLFLILATFAGAVHMLAPDHWMPLSLASWQRRWSASKTLLVSLSVFSVHLGAGFLIYLTLRPVILTRDSHWLFPVSVALVVLAACVRAVRFGRIREMLRLGSNRIWGALSILSLVGPCESLIPVMIKAHHVGMGYLSAFAAFAVGTVFSGLLVIMSGHFFWNQPIRLNQGVSWGLKPRSVIPAAVGVVLGLIFLLKM